jgi:hypothetical protein
VTSRVAGEETAVAQMHYEAPRMAAERFTLLTHTKGIAAKLTLNGTVDVGRTRVGDNPSDTAQALVLRI